MIVFAALVGCTPSAPKAPTSGTPSPDTTTPTPTPTPDPTGTGGCETLLSARLAADRSLDGCDVEALDETAPPGCEGLSPNACAEALFVDPQPQRADPGDRADMWLVILPECADGTDGCASADRVRCADGTRGLVYVDKATDASGADIDSDRWLFFGDAGGAVCDSDESCEGMYQVLGMHGTSSHQAGVGYDGTGVLDSAPGRNPLHDYNRVFVERCTADSLAGRSAPITRLTSGSGAPLEAPIFHHGALGYEAAFRHLARPEGASYLAYGAPCADDGPCDGSCDVEVGRCEEPAALPSLAAADKVVLVGFSGASRGLVHNGDAFAAVLGELAPAADVSLVLDAAFSPSLENELRWETSGAERSGDMYAPAIDVPDLAHPIAMEEDEDGPGNELISSGGFEVGGATREGLAWWGTAEDASCLAAHGDPYPWQCAEREHVIANHLTTDAFLAHRLYDQTETGGPTAVPVHGWMHSRAACREEATEANCYNWHDDSYRARTHHQLLTFLSRHATAGEEQPYAGTFAAFATEGSHHEGLVDPDNLTHVLGQCVGGVIAPGSEVSLIGAIEAFIDGALPSDHWGAVEGAPHPNGGVWSAPGRCL